MRLWSKVPQKRVAGYNLVMGFGFCMGEVLACCNPSLFREGKNGNME